MTSDVQPSLFEDDLQSKFEKFHRENPHVYATLVRLARDARRRGFRRIGIGMLYEVARWEIALATNDADFKLNNNWRSRFARLIEKQEPDLAGMFEMRELRA